MIMNLSVGLLGALLSWTLGLQTPAPQAGRMTATFQATEQPRRSVELIPLGEAQVEFPGPGVKVVRQLFQVTDSRGNVIVLPGACIGRCLGGSSDEVNGCEPTQGGCSKIRCTGDQPCRSICTKVLTDYLDSNK